MVAVSGDVANPVTFAVMRIALFVCFVMACGSAPREPVPPAPGHPELSTALARLDWWLGDWASDSGSEHWVAAGGAMYGVALATSGEFEVMIVDDADGPGPADGILRFIAMPGGRDATEFREQAIEAQQATFANPAHDAPKTIRYAREGTALVATLDGGAQTFTFRPTTRQRAPELERADMAFAADTKARGIDGWMAAFEPQAGMISRGKRIEGEDIRKTMAPLLGSGVLAWRPIASGVSGSIGFTVGKATFSGANAADNFATSYVTIWRKQPDGSWKVLFDVGRPVNAR